MTRKSPNILFIMADQLAPHFTGAYGHPVVQTPNLDRLAARGARFDAAYCNSPLCAPARFSLMSGQLVTRIGAYDNASEFPASIPTLAHYLRLMGYRTCLSGKMHFIGPDQLHGFDERVTTDVYPSDFAWTPDWENAGARIGKWYHNMESVREAGTAAATFQIDYDEEVAFAAKRRIFDYARDGDTPFCLAVSFIHPHDPYVARPEWWDRYDPSSIDLPTTGPDDVVEDPLSARIAAGIEADTQPPSDAEIRNARQAYYANTTFVDSKVGELVAALEEAGFAENTVVVFTSDHGDMLGERGLWYKMSFFEQSVRVPLIVAGPGVAHRAVPNACAHVDLLPTFLEIAGLDGRATPEAADPLDGRSLWPLATGAEDASDTAIGEYCAEMTSHPVFMIRRGGLKYVHCATDPPQLYDLSCDPMERENLAEHPDYAAQARAFAEEVAERWDEAALRKAVVADQRRRQTVHAAMETGTRVHWDYAPPRDANNEYVRNHMDWTVAAARNRFPPLEE